MKSELCPVCKGEGYIWKDYGGQTKRVYDKCHGCDGKGWILIPENKHLRAGGMSKNE